MIFKTDKTLIMGKINLDYITQFSSGSIPFKTNQINLIWGHTLVTLYLLESSSARKTGIRTITWVTGLSNQAILATVVSTVLSIFSYVTGYKKIISLHVNIYKLLVILKNNKSCKSLQEIKQMRFVILRIQPANSAT